MSEPGKAQEPKAGPTVKKEGLSKSSKATKMRRTMVIKGIIAGKTIKEAAIDAGYSPQSAGAQGTEILKHPEAQAAFARVMEKAGISDDFLAQKIRSLLDAKEIKYYQKDGKVTDEREVEALETQRKTAELATKLKGHLKDRSEIDVNIGLMALVVAAVKSDSGGEEPFDV